MCLDIHVVMFNFLNIRNKHIPGNETGDTIFIIVALGKLQMRGETYLPITAHRKQQLG